MDVDEKLISLMKKYYGKIDHSIGYPVCQYPNIAGFGEWYVKSGMCDMVTNNAGNPYDGEQLLLNTTIIERGLTPVKIFLKNLTPTSLSFNQDLRAFYFISSVSLR